MSKSVQKVEARELRLKGKSIKKIAKKLGVSVGSVSIWCRDIELSLDQKKILDINARNPYYGGRGVYLRNLKKRTDLKAKKLEKAGVKEIGKLGKRELFLTGAALYWAEGFKKDSQVGLASLDSKMIKFFIKWLKVCFGYKDQDLMFRLTVNISHKYRISEIEKHWSEELKIPLSQFQKPFYQNFIWKKVYDNPEDYFGVLRVKVRKSKDFLRKIYGFIDGLRLQAQV
ncbi:MAG: hypothetical protein ACD_13C00107G0004 [uncultured bacterium]|uniref:Resolvase helix-turn-helix domain protein n=1 Tax=Candidatus Woesebacteria bacterium GW2011_GWA1_40_43 TaxID=1618553 RepID=A0A0G0SIS4_9BACT|nr:MAG: hypothetical protein ACD_13C00107G0004 [uncultured bacterium]KKR53050.1 MAG: hypothetical protein UT88_C0015G0014 [Candidatus Woesebacteria bacterium GW2011_GWD2_40_19]KKR58734.1 MAG: hypothetical protein UT96_C0001G0017 [Candidatus Woesebacteria bacterium GW2011_GWC2_40_30]KKR64689.1 MAG: hypothetical protein UU02_C0003G0006 [Candidatus Woesebacteria bacterium GW2011_GWA1_40_43]HAU65202.1 hypothetical protein [Candidatus Woesebacteria bacterium]